MAVNPMKRRTRNSFLIGFLLALIIGALVVIALVYKMQGIKEDYEALKALQQKVYVASDDIQSGTEVTMESLKLDTVQTTISSDEFITSEDFDYIDDKTGEIVEKYDQDNNPIQKKMVAKTNIPAGTIITREMLDPEDSVTGNDQRMQEYNMIILPTLLVNGDYIDIRLQLPEGEDYIVVSKKKVEHTTTDTVWLKMNEDEILTLGNAIVEAYTIVGSKLYATIYTEAGLQKAAEPTYPVSASVLALINKDPNVINKAREALWARYTNQEQVDQRNNHINEALSGYYDNMKDSVEAGLQEEITKMQTGRQTYVEALEGTGMVGTDN